MKLRDLAKLGVFLIGVYRLSRALSHLAALPLTFGGEPRFVWLALATWGVDLALTASFLVVPSWWARLVFSEAQEIRAPAIPYARISELLFAFVGLVVLASAIPQAVAELVRWRQGSVLGLQPEQQGLMSMQALPTRLGLIVNLLLGFLLLLGRRGLAASWRAARRAGHEGESA
jgi:hypothetical protein